MKHNKAMFANTINTLGSHSNLSANECERYGMTWGCDSGCPVFSRGDCKIEDVQGMRELILETDRFDDCDLNELNKIYPQLEL